MNFPNSAGVIDIGSTPIPAKRAFTLEIGNNGVDLFVEPVDDFGGRILWRADTLPAARLVARQKFIHGGDFGQHFQTSQ